MLSNVKSVYRKPHLIFFLSIPVLLISGFIFGSELIDLNIHDTYIVIGNFHFYTLISILFLLLGIGYWIAGEPESKLAKWLTWIHIGLTFGGGFLVLILYQYYGDELMEFTFNRKLTSVIQPILLIILVSQCAFVFNLVLGLANRMKKISR